MVPLLVEKVEMDYCMSSAWDGPITQSECCINVKYCYLNSLRAFKKSVCVCVYIYIYIYIYLFIYLYCFFEYIEYIS